MNKKDKSRIRCSCFFYMGILVLFGTGFLMAETLAAESTHPESFYGRRIERIEIRGNARSLDATVLRIAELEEGRILQKESIERAALKLEKSSLFAEVDIRVNSDAGEDRAVKIVISLEEKWTLIPVPFFASDGESIMGGLVVVEANLLGTGTQVVAGGMAGNSGLYGFTALVLPSFLGSPWRLSSSLSGGETESEIRTPDNREALTFASRSAGGSFGLAYRITNSITAGFKTTLEQHEIRDTQGFEGNMGESIIGLSLLFNYDGTVPYGSLRKGVMFLSEAAYLFGYPGPSLDAQLLYNIPSFAEGRIRLFALGGYGNRPIVAEKSISGQDGFRTLPFGKVSADDYWSLAAAYEWPVLTRNWGALVFNTFFEQGWYRSSEVGSFFFCGPGAGFRMYMKKIALPALGLDIAYNLLEERTVFSVAVGMRR